MIKFELLETYIGWEGATLPDNHKIRANIGDTSLDVFVCLRDICKIYGHAINRKEAKMMIGTGNDVILSKEDKNRVGFELSGRQTIVCYQELEDELDSLLRSMFKALDQRGSDARDEQLEILDDWIVDHEIEFDLKSKYANFRDGR